MSKTDKKSVFSWCFYDWANTAFSTVIITFIFGVYFARSIVGDETEGSAQWSFAIAASGFVIAFLGPILGAVADNSGARKHWIFWLSMLCILPSALLWFAMPNGSPSHIIFVLGLIALANIGLELSTVFYNAMLPHVAPKEKLGRVSGWAWGLGYLGGLTALAISLFGFIGLGEVKPFLPLPTENFEHIRITGPFVAVWFFIFMMPLLFFTKDVEIKPLPFRKALSTGIHQLVESAKSVRKYKNLIRFLIASAIYRDGLVTLFAIGGVYAADQFGMEFKEILIFAIGLNITAGLGAFAFAFADDKFGSKPTIVISLIGLILIGGTILLITDKNLFLILSLGLGIFMGPVQAASRTMISKLCAPDLITQSYGLYAFTGKSISFLGPLAFGIMTTVFETQQAGMASIIIFWVVGLLVLLKVKEERIVS
ncbi:MAG: MFS transporter [Alphaproteobacteria bacterium]